jgi:hypothetical protein
MTDLEPAIRDWLLDADPAIGWQTMRDLLGADAGTVEAERERVANEGWGAAILSQQDSAGTWANGLYNPKWRSTFYTLLTLRDLGLEPRNEAASRGAAILLERGLRPDGGLRYNVPARDVHEAGETCITGMGLAICAYFRLRVDALEPLIENLFAEQMPDGGWNCQRPNGATHSSFHTTISALAGLLEWQRATVAADRRVAEARDRAHEFLFVHGMFRSHTTGRVAHSSFTRFPFPAHWHYDLLRGLDYLRSAGAPRDSRIEPAIALVESRRLPDGRWPAYARYPGASWVEFEPPREPGRWNTLRALRVLDWWHGRDAGTQHRPAPPVR